MAVIIRDPSLAQEDLTDDFLRHHGVLGMKWGHHRSEGGDSGGSGKDGSSAPKVKKAKPTTQDIKNARFRSDARAEAVDNQIVKYHTADTAKGKKEAEDTIARIQKEGADDLKLARKSTRGEKIGIGILAGAVGAQFLVIAAAGSHAH